MKRVLRNTYVVVYLLLGDEFEGDNLATSLSAAFVDFSKGAFSDGVQYVILIHIISII